MINVVIVEDEKAASDLLLSYFDTYSERKGEKFHVVVFNEPTAFLMNYKPNYDLVLMDIKMSTMNGMEAARKLRAVDKAVTLIFVTNMSQYAVKGYEVDAFDYIVKPVSYYDFAFKLGRALERIKSRNEVRIRIAMEDAVKIVTPIELKYIEVSNHRLVYHTTDGDYCATGTLRALETVLTPVGFAKCNNYLLVNLRYVTGFYGYTVKVGDEELQISHPKRKEFISVLNQYLGENF